MNSIEICVGAGRQALGLKQTGFEHIVLAEYESEYCECLRNNRPHWNVICGDVRGSDSRSYHNKIEYREKEETKCPLQKRK